ncbi:MAG TPA: hypothetical protein VMY59_01130 [Candidatus Thermoplasmatota archaeon]|nr:hypothetical protein [Candidatus Thermoplasmatota archaeon]
MTPIQSPLRYIQAFFNSIVSGMARSTQRFIAHFLAYFFPPYNLPHCRSACISPADLSLENNDTPKGIYTLHFEWNLAVYDHRYVNTYMYIEQQQQQQQNSIVQIILYRLCIDYTKHLGRFFFGAEN